MTFQCLDPLNASVALWAIKRILRRMESFDEDMSAWKMKLHSQIGSGKLEALCGRRRLGHWNPDDEPTPLLECPVSSCCCCSCSHVIEAMRIHGRLILQLISSTHTHKISSYSNNCLNTVTVLDWNVRTCQKLTSWQGDKDAQLSNPMTALESWQTIAWEAWCKQNVYCITAKKITHTGQRARFASKRVKGEAFHAELCSKSFVGSASGANPGFKWSETDRMINEDRQNFEYI